MQGMSLLPRPPIEHIRRRLGFQDDRSAHFGNGGVADDAGGDPPDSGADDVGQVRLHGHAQADRDDCPLWVHVGLPQADAGHEQVRATTTAGIILPEVL